MKFNKKILMISAATLMLVSPVASLANANTISAASVKKVSYAKQTTVTVKKKTPQLFMATGGRALTTGKYYKKGQKLTVSQTAIAMWNPETEKRPLTKMAVLKIEQRALAKLKSKLASLGIKSLDDIFSPHREEASQVEFA